MNLEQAMGHVLLDVVARVIIPQARPFAAMVAVSLAISCAWWVLGYVMERFLNARGFGSINTSLDRSERMESMKLGRTINK